MGDEHHDEGRKMQNYGSLRDKEENISNNKCSVGNAEESTPLLGQQSSSGPSRGFPVNLFHNVYSGFSRHSFRC